jgi:beta-phosphoglucomutase-like phosphatase (HAD superfamily)
MPAPPDIDARAVEVLLCDADGCLFPSEEPAFVASAGVTNEFLAEIGAAARFTAEELRLATTGRNFRTTAAALAQEEGLPLDSAALERWVEAERARVTAHLGDVLAPDGGVLDPLSRLAGEYALAVVTSSAASRLGACLAATGLDGLFAQGKRFSAESSLPRPTSKPDPAIYVHAGEQLGIAPGEGLAIEDSVPGAQAAIAAGFATVGNLAFVPASERAGRLAALERAGVAAMVDSWAELERLLASSRRGVDAVVGGARR